MDDERIIELYFERDEQAVEETSCKYGLYCMGIAFGVLGVPEDAEECVNDALHAAWQSIPPERPACLRAYLGRIVRNTAINRYRALRAKKRFDGTEVLLSELAECVPSRNDVEEIMERKRLSELISAWLDTLPPADSALFVRRYWYGEGVSELARECECAPRALTQRMLRLRRRLKTYLESEGASR